MPGIGNVISHCFGRTSGVASPTFDTATIADMTARGIAYDNTVYYSGTPQERTGTQWWTYVNDLVLDLKGIGTTTGCFDSFADWLNIHLPVGTTANNKKVNLVLPGTRDVNWQGTWNHNNSTGSIPDGSTAYANFNVAPNDLNPNDCFLFVINGARHGAAGGCPLGSATSGEANAWALLPNLQGLYFATVNDYSTYSEGNSSGIGMLCLNRPDATHTESYQRGTRWGNFTQSATTGITTKFSYGALDAGGTRVRFSSNEWLGGGVSTKHYTQAQVAIIDLVFYNFLKKMGMNYLTCQVFGNSITEGIGVTNNSYRISSLICTAKNWAEDNKGVSGATMENSTPYNPLGADNFSEKVLTSAPYVLGTTGAVIFEYCTNDVGINVSGYNATLYTSQMGAAIDVLLGSKAFPPGRVLSLGEFFCTELSWADYLTFLPGIVTVPADGTRNDAFGAANKSVAAAKGILQISPIDFMGGATGGDGRHPNDAKAAAIVTNGILPVLINI